MRLSQKPKEMSKCLKKAEDKRQELERGFGGLKYLLLMTPALIGWLIITITPVPGDLILYSNFHGY